MNQDNNSNGDGNNDHDSVSKEQSNMNDDDVNAEKDDNTKDNNDDNDNDDVSKELNNMNIDSRSKKRGTCLYCLQVVKGSMRCDRCETALYCGRECQVKHWPVHKNTCLDSNDTESSDEKLEMKAMNHVKQGNCMYIYTKELSLLTL